MNDLVEARTSEIHGTGVFAVTDIAEGTLIGVYEGEPTDVDGTHVLWIDDDEAPKAPPSLLSLMQRTFFHFFLHFKWHVMLLLFFRLNHERNTASTRTA